MSMCAMCSMLAVMKITMTSHKRETAIRMTDIDGFNLPARDGLFKTPAFMGREEGEVITLAVPDLQQERIDGGSTGIGRRCTTRGDRNRRSWRAGCCSRCRGLVRIAASA